jgi:hypothetical protein
METEEIDDESEVEIGENPPEFSISELLNSFRTRGFLATLDDENIGPHSHLIVILGIVFLISIIIGAYILVA